MARPGGPRAPLHDPVKQRDDPDKGPERTLDLLDELIGTIHRSRLSTFAARARKHEKRIKRRAEQLSQATASRHRNMANLRFVDEQQADEEDERILEELSSQFAVPAPVPAKREKEKEALPAPRAQLFKGGTQTFNKLDDLQAEIAAAKIFEEFRVELQKFITTDPIRRNTREGREEFADYLVDKYLAKRLDPLPTSKTVSGVRKAVSEIAEKLASADDVSADFGSEFFGIDELSKNDPLSTVLRDTAKGKDSMGRYKNPDDDPNPSASRPTKQDKVAAKQAREAAEAAAAPANRALLAAKVAASSAGGGKTTVLNQGKVVETETERLAREKARIKEQYEAYRRLERTNADAVDKEKKVEVEALADDIRGLLSAVQSVGRSK